MPTVLIFYLLFHSFCMGVMATIIFGEFDRSSEIVRKLVEPQDIILFLIGMIFAPVAFVILMIDKIENFD